MHGCQLFALLQASYINGKWQSAAKESREYDIRGRGQRPGAVHDSQWRSDAARNEGSLQHSTSIPVAVGFRVLCTVQFLFAKNHLQGEKGDKGDKGDMGDQGTE